MPKQRTAHECDHCGVLYKTPNGAVKHEKRCTKNPDNIRPCMDCIFSNKKETTVYFDDYYGYTGIKVSLIHCDKKDHFIYPPMTEHKGNAISCDDIEGGVANDPMPKECDLHISTYQRAEAERREFYN